MACSQYFICTDFIGLYLYTDFICTLKNIIDVAVAYELNTFVMSAIVYI